jgi:hypothetical protein
MIARSTWWAGSLGIYDAAGSSRPFGRVLTEEGRLHFATVDEALRYLYVGSFYDKPVFTNSGLVFCYAVSEPKESWQGVVRTVKVWQIYINGKRPTTLPGADDSAIAVTGGAIPDTSVPNPRPVGYELVLGKQPYDPRNPPRE